MLMRSIISLLTLISGFSGTLTPSVSRSASSSPSASPSGICNSIQNSVFGTFESVQGDVLYYITHGIKIEHKYNDTKNITVGVFGSCTTQSSSCVCSYPNGENLIGCMNRYGSITYSFGTTTQTSFTIQDPPCNYFFSSSYALPSSSSSTSPSNSISPTNSLSQSVSSSVSPSNSISVSVTYSPSESSLFFTSRYATQTPTAFETPAYTPSNTPTITNTPAFLKTAYPSINHISPSTTSSPLFMAVPFPSATNTPHVFEASDNPTESAMGKAGVASAGVAVGGSLVMIAQKLLQKFRPPTNQSNQSNKNQNNNLEDLDEKLKKAKRLLQSNDKIQIIVDANDLSEIEMLLITHRKNYQTIG